MLQLKPKITLNSLFADHLLSTIKQSKEMYVIPAGSPKSKKTSKHVVLRFFCCRLFVE